MFISWTFRAVKHWQKDILKFTNKIIIELINPMENTDFRCVCNCVCMIKPTLSKDTHT